MSGAPAITLLDLTWLDWLGFFLHFMLLSLLSVGGAVSTLPDMHRYLVNQQHWMSDAQFNASVALAQAAPGPNVLFVALMGWHVGANTGSLWMALLGVLIAMVGIILPSATLTFSFANWSHHNRELIVVRSFKLGMAPIVIGLLLATGWIMASAPHDNARLWAVALLTAISALLVWRTQIHLLWLLGAGALCGWFGFI
ncbi:chromate transporter [Undibacterium seohonense]|jgi:chromate transporter|uniref:Chromate transporter n=1 Tax=Undibacterium seohonense TaxID=1344950 RepID=A0ABR6X2U4_9BURK|nr:chromate transporter [Undibacterium seohonense]MBC3807275.1 chromate transporter [Undibacterium seohonense]